MEILQLTQKERDRYIQEFHILKKALTQKCNLDFRERLFAIKRNEAGFLKPNLLFTAMRKELTHRLGAINDLLGVFLAKEKLHFDELHVHAKLDDELDVYSRLLHEDANAAMVNTFLFIDVSCKWFFMPKENRVNRSGRGNPLTSKREGLRYDDAVWEKFAAFEKISEEEGKKNRTFRKEFLEPMAKMPQDIDTLEDRFSKIVVDKGVLIP